MCQSYLVLPEDLGRPQKGRLEVLLLVPEVLVGLKSMRLVETLLALVWLFLALHGVALLFVSIALG